jgi:hypothetical protein
MAENNANHHLFVDESGDAVLFGGDGPRFFMLGAVHLPDPDDAHHKLEQLRQSLLTDPYFATVPSMQAAEKKTALAFHAKDDLAEVRREVFRLLPQFGATVQVAIRRKHDMAREAKELREKRYHRTPEMAYDDLVERVLVDMIRPDGQTHILFAWLGKSDRIAALKKAISQVVRWQESPDDPSFMDRVFVSVAYPKDAAGLQVADYYLWAVQRMFEKGEVRFFNSVASSYRLILDLDDKRHSEQGAAYHAQNPLHIDKIKPVAG